MYDLHKGKIRRIILILVAIIVYSLPLVLIHILFRIPAPVAWLVPKWDVSDVLAYTAGFETLLGTIVLGFISIVQTKKANDLSVKLAEDSSRIQQVSIQNSYPITKITSFSTEQYEDYNSDSRFFHATQASQIYVVNEYSMKEVSKSVYLFLCDIDGAKYQKEFNIEISNISSSVINSIEIEKVEFPGVNGFGKEAKSVTLSGIKKHSIIRTMIMPKDLKDMKNFSYLMQMMIIKVI